MSDPHFEKHRKTLETALETIKTRGYWSAYPEIPSGRVYGETAKDDGLKAFEARLNKPFEIDQPGTTGQVGAEVSPYGTKLGITYPKADLDQLVAAVKLATPLWAHARPEVRVGVCMEILERINKRSFEFANAVMHTTGQGFMMAFQAGGPHAQDRGLEAIAYAYQEMKRCPEDSTWKKQVGKDTFVTLQKHFRIIPRGIAVTIGCSTFPTWNGYPGIFASLATGNAVIVKPHPGAILPLAMTIEIGREVLKESGFNPNLLTLVADTLESPVTSELSMRPEVGIIDYTGGPSFGNWLEQNVRHATVFTEKAGVNSVILDSIDDLKAVTGNLAFSLSLYSGQMCTTPQNIFIPKDGIAVGDKHMSFEEVGGALVKAVNWLLSDAARATEILGGIQNPATYDRVKKAAGEGGEVLRASESITDERFPQSRTSTPLLIKLDASQRELYMREMFGPIAYLIATRDTIESVSLAAECARQHGAITSAVYSTNPQTLREAENELLAAGAAVSCNLTGQIFVNQAAAYSDFHVSGINPSGNATLCDAAFVAPRFRVAQSRVQLAS